MPTLEARGVEIAWSAQGQGQPVLLVHETAADGSVWDAVAESVARRARAITYDRRGWGNSSAPEDYRRTTVEEQSEDAAALLESAGAVPAIIVGAGVGATLALDLLLRRSDLVAATMLIEPPVLQLLPMATEALSQDRRRLELAAESGEDMIELYLSGALPALGAEVSRLPERLAGAARERPGSVIAEMGISAAWRVPLPRLAAVERPSAIVTGLSTSPLLRDAAAALADRLAGSSAHEVDSGTAPPHVGAPDQVGALALALTP
ncbi:MAG TPA: alpha/beta hydrolase [Solirubrobacterales bacterium]|nr:alpha/beta hydrolase [Solirubrobacterales bacterium]